MPQPPGKVKMASTGALAKGLKDPEKRIETTPPVTLEDGSTVQFVFGQDQDGVWHAQAFRLNEPIFLAPG